MGRKGNNLLAVEMMAVQEGIDRHGKVAPPDRISQENRIVLTQITEGILDSRPDFTHKFQLGLGDQGFVVRRIGFVWHDAEDIGTGLVGNDLADVLGTTLQAFMSLPSGSEK